MGAKTPLKKISKLERRAFKVEATSPGEAPGIPVALPMNTHMLYVHNYNSSTTQEGKPKEYLLFIPDRLLEEPYANSTFSGRKELLLFKKQQHNQDDTSQPPEHEFIRISDGTIVLRKDQTAHKSEKQYTGPSRIIQHLYGDFFLIQKTTRSSRLTELHEKCNARMLKIAPNIIQQEYKSIPLSNGDTETVILHRGRGRPKKNTIDTLKEIETADPQTTKRRRGRTHKNPEQEK
uniref:Doublecortin domain-containing protein n=1 Tax=Strongyloides papillosus TaxID=174720 RepID=A0A0N5BRM9_STREA